MSAEWLALVLRLLLIGGIYLFLWQVVLVIRRDLRATRPVAVPSARGAARLAVVDPAKSSLLPGQTLSLAGVNPIGRSPTSAIRIDDEFVSARHAILSQRQGHWWLEDLESTNGTFVNGRPVDRPTPVSAGDLIEIGRTRFRLEDA